MTKNVNEVLHYPRLDTVLMVEEAIKNAKEYSSKRQLWLSLKKKVMYQTFNIVIDYLVSVYRRLDLSLSHQMPDLEIYKLAVHHF